MNQDHLQPAARQMRRDFSSRAELVTYLQDEFPLAAARSPEISPTIGGRPIALATLEILKPDRYGFNRNFLNGSVSRLSMYIRHGVLTLSEVRDAALSKVSDVLHASKFITELAWREYWQRIYRGLGNGIWRDQEEPKTGYGARDYADSLPEDIPAARTGLACMDGFATELRETGYLHNHARMWMAAYVVHWRRVKWQAGARWFLTHLLDGDPASNNLSWQWVASTFSNKPYFFNRENLDKYTNSRYCEGCSLAAQCPLDASYADLELRLFPNKRTVATADSLKQRNSGSHRRHPRGRKGTQ
jgi:deoxyribodipyrimidine photo-lyase